MPIESSLALTPTMQAFVLHFGEMGSRWGINRTIGQIFALLVIYKDPLNADQIAEALSVSRGNVSMSLKELQAWRLIKVQHKPGDRKEYFTAIEDVWQMAIRVLEERRKREVDPTLTLLRDLLLTEPHSSQDNFALTQVQAIHDLLEMLTHWSDELQNTDTKHLKRMVKIGTGVGKVLDIKNKLMQRDPSQPSTEDTSSVSPPNENT